MHMSPGLCRDKIHLAAGLFGLSHQSPLWLHRQAASRSDAQRSNAPCWNLPVHDPGLPSSSLTRLPSMTVHAGRATTHRAVHWNKPIPRLTSCRTFPDRLWRYNAVLISVGMAGGSSAAARALL